MVSEEQIIDLVNRMASGTLTAEDFQHDEGLTDDDRAMVLAVLNYVCVRSKRHRKWKAQRRAMGLLRSLLSQEQRSELHCRRSFTVIGSKGGRYRLIPATGSAHLVERHGKHDYARLGFCLHGDMDVPAADTTIGQMMLLLSDEGAFLSTANSRLLGDLLWNGDWRRRLNESRRTKGGDALCQREHDR